MEKKKMYKYYTIFVCIFRSLLENKLYLVVNEMICIRVKITF